MTFLRALLLGLVATLLISAQVAFRWQEGISELPSAWRFWDDMTLGIARYVDWTSEGSAFEKSGVDLAPLVRSYRPLVEEKVRTFSVQSHQFWKTVNDQKFRVRRVAYGAPRFEDPGRAYLLALGFLTLGGVAPYLLLWLGVAFALPVMVWLAYELGASGYWVAAGTTLCLLAASPFVVECLSLPHSAVAFYLAALTAVAAFSIAALRPGMRVRGFVMRALGLALVLIVAVWCRSGSIAFLPAAVGAACLGFSRIGWSLAKSSGASLGLIAIPVLLSLPGNKHNLWLGLWEGLGDFGTDRGYSWYDTDANRFLKSQGIAPFADPKDVNAEHEAAFRKAFLADISAHPAWYAGVLMKRTFATVASTKLWPWGPRDGESRTTPLFHYKYTMPIDWLGFKDRLFELPISALILPAVVFLALDVTRGSRDGSLVLGIVAIGALPIPVAISTASALETQAFGLVYLLGAAFLAQRVFDVVTGKPKNA